MSPFVDLTKAQLLASHLIPGIPAPKSVPEVGVLQPATGWQAKTGALDTLRADLKLAARPAEALAQVAVATSPLQTGPTPESTGPILPEAQEALAGLSQPAEATGALQQSFMAGVPLVVPTVLAALLGAAILIKLCHLGGFAILSHRQGQPSPAADLG